MVVLEFHAVHIPRADRIERAVEGLRIAQTAERSCLVQLHLLEFDLTARAMFYPPLGLDVSPKDGRPRIREPHRALQRRHQIAGLAASNQYRVGARQALYRLAQAAERKDLAPAEGIERVQQDDIEIARQPGVLEAIVQQEHIGTELLAKQCPGAIPVRPDADRRYAGAQEDLRFIARFARWAR